MEDNNSYQNGQQNDFSKRDLEFDDFKFLLNKNIYLILGSVPIIWYLVVKTNFYPVGLNFSDIALSVFSIFVMGIIPILILFVLVNVLYFIITFCVKTEFRIELESKNELRLFQSLPIIILIILYTLVQSNFPIRNVLDLVGIKKKNVTLQVNDKELSEIKRISEQFNLPVFYGCDDIDKNNIYNMEVLWHGIGSHALLKFPISNKGGDEKKEYLRTITVKNETLSVSHRTFAKGCLTYTIDELPAFTAKESEVKTEMKSQISEKVTLLQSDWLDSYDIKKVTITGFSDKRDIKNKLGNNYDISKKRAEDAKDVLSNLCKSQGWCSIIDKAEIKGNGRKNTAEKCEHLSAKQFRLKKYQSEVDECFASDRKVEFQFEFIPKK